MIYQGVALLNSKWYNELMPENEKAPGDAKLAEGNFEKLMLLRAMRPDRVTAGLPNWAAKHLGTEYTECDAKFSPYEIFTLAFEDCDNVIPM